MSRKIFRRLCGDVGRTLWGDVGGLRERFLAAALLRSPTDPERPWLEILHDLT